MACCTRVSSASPIATNNPREGPQCAARNAFVTALSIAGSSSEEPSGSSPRGLPSSAESASRSALRPGSRPAPRRVALKRTSAAESASCPTLLAASTCVSALAHTSTRSLSHEIPSSVPSGSTRALTSVPYVAAHAATVATAAGSASNEPASIHNDIHVRPWLGLGTNTNEASPIGAT